MFSNRARQKAPSAEFFGASQWQNHMMTQNKSIRASLICSLTLASVALTGCLRQHSEEFSRSFAPVPAPQVTASGATAANVTAGNTSQAAPAILDTDCAALVPPIWHAQGYYHEPLEKTAAQTAEGHGCQNPFQPGKKKRSTPE